MSDSPRRAKPGRFAPRVFLMPLAGSTMPPLDIRSTGALRTISAADEAPGVGTAAALATCALALAVIGVVDVAPPRIKLNAVALLDEDLESERVGSSVVVVVVAAPAAVASELCATKLNAEVRAGTLPVAGAFGASAAACEALTDSWSKRPPPPWGFTVLVATGAWAAACAVVLPLPSSAAGAGGLVGLAVFCCLTASPPNIVFVSRAAGGAGPRGARAGGAAFLVGAEGVDFAAGLDD
jgi:hypothetical protein